MNTSPGMVDRGGIVFRPRARAHMSPATTTARLNGRAQLREGNTMIKIKCTCGVIHTFLIKYKGQDVATACDCGRTIAVDTSPTRRTPKAVVFNKADTGLIPVREVA